MEIDTWKLIKILRLLRFLMRRVLPAPLAVFFQRKLALARLEVFLRPVIVALAVRALEADEIWLRHANFLSEASKLLACAAEMLENCAPST